jgi:hypothetical protein
MTRTFCLEAFTTRFVREDLVLDDLLSLLRAVDGRVCMVCSSLLRKRDLIDVGVFMGERMPMV